MLLTRALDERISTLSTRDGFGISGSARGHEAAQVASAWALKPGHDVVFPYYRDIGVALTLGLTPLDILLGALDKATDPFSGAGKDAVPLHVGQAPHAHAVYLHRHPDPPRRRGGARQSPARRGRRHRDVVRRWRDQQGRLS